MKSKFRFTLLALSIALPAALAGEKANNEPFEYPPRFSEWTNADKAASDSMPSDYTPIGRLETRDSKNIGHSLLGIGGETQDRDFTDFEAWKTYLGPLGAKHIRLQSGWAKTETSEGKYDFRWLDQIVDGCRLQGVQPWLNVSYGNPLYPGGGGTGLAGGLIESDEALAAWDRYVRALIRHFRDRVNTFEIWNEADHGANNAQPGAYARLFERSARIIREEHANATILGLALAGVSADEGSALVDFVEYLNGRDALHLVDTITIHGYPHNPDHGFRNVAAIRAYLDRHAPHVSIWQGETGAPSERGTQFALRDLDWSELTQAKWDLRRALAHWSRNIPFSLFSISEMNYTQKERFNTLNTKGILKINPDDLSIDRPKVAYFAYRNLCSVFSDGMVPRQSNLQFESDSASLYAFAVQDSLLGIDGLVFWDRARPPEDMMKAKAVSLHVGPLRMQSPVLVDLLTGKVYDVPESAITQNGPHYTISGLPVWDSPRMLCDRSLVAWTASDN